MEGESMRVVFEPFLVQNKVDVVLAGHVHAYERSERISNIAYNVTNSLCSPVDDHSAPVYITIGDGGNLEGLVWEYVLKLINKSILVLYGLDSRKKSRPVKPWSYHRITTTCVIR
ncbi:unnamed protein product [Linum tenue]|nr:unnamed protein product [Linum tenue]